MLSPRFLKLLPAIASFILATAIFVQTKAWTVDNSAASFHEAIRAAVASIPARFGDWEGADIPVPQPAARLLRPNALFARHYENETTLRGANLVLIHCTDSRDMSGHYPPNCYPASGWVQDGPVREISLQVGDRTIPAVIYEFQRTDVGTIRSSIVYNFFVLPGGFATSMKDVQIASGDRRWRPYGAAQVQIILDPSMSEFVQLEVVQQLLEPLGSIIDTLQVRKKGERP